MIIIQPFPGGVTDYFFKNEDWYRSTSFLCPCCGGKTHRHGKYIRTVYVPEQKEGMPIPIFRRRCPTCKITFSLIPSFIKPYARFSNNYRFNLFHLHAVMGISINLTPIAGSPNGNIISVTTFRRWLNRFKGIAREVNTLITTRLLELRPGLSPPHGISDIAFLLHTGEALRLIIQVIVPEENFASCGLFDMLNLQLPSSLWV